MSLQLELFAAEAHLDTYSFTIPRAAYGDDCAVTPAEPAHTVAHTGLCGVRHWGAQGTQTRSCDDSAAAPPTLGYPMEASSGSYPVLTAQGQLLSIRREWGGKQGRDVFRYLLTQAVGAPISLRRVSTPRAESLDARRTGALFLVGGRAKDLIVRLSSGARPDSRQAKVSLHMNRRTYSEMCRYGSAIQAVVTRVCRPDQLDLLVTAAIPWAVLEPLVADALTTAPDGRAALSLEVTSSARGVTLRAPEADLDVSHYAGLEVLAAELRRDPCEPWRSLSHADWMAVVTSVLTLRDGLHCAVAPLDSRKRVNRSILDELGIRGVHGHQIGLPPASREALVYTDVIAVPSSLDLSRGNSRPPLLAIEIDARSNMTAVQELALRMQSAERLGLNVIQGIVVADDAKRPLFEERCAVIRDEYRERMRFWSMRELYQAYCTARVEQLRRVSVAQRAAVRRAA